MFDVHIMPESCNDDTGSFNPNGPATARAAYLALQATKYRLPSGWAMYIHPRGWVYFRCDEYKVVVDEDIRVPETLERITSICMKENLALLSDGQELCIVGFNSDSALYLAVDHTQCTAEYGLEFSSVTQPIRDISLSRGKFAVSNRKLYHKLRWPVLRRRQLYWNFVSRHPTHVSVPPDTFMYTVDIVKSYYLGSFSAFLSSLELPLTSG